MIIKEKIKQNPSFYFCFLGIFLLFGVSAFLIENGIVLGPIYTAIMLGMSLSIIMSNRLLYKILFTVIFFYIFSFINGIFFGEPVGYAGFGVIFLLIFFIGMTLLEYFSNKRIAKIMIWIITIFVSIVYIIYIIEVFDSL